jgi:hypothetical protein
MVDSAGQWRCQERSAPMAVIFYQPTKLQNNQQMQSIISPSETTITAAVPDALEVSSP